MQHMYLISFVALTLAQSEVNQAYDRSQVQEYYESAPALDSVYENTPFVESADDPNDVLYAYDDYGEYLDDEYDDQVYDEEMDYEGLYKRSLTRKPMVYDEYSLAVDYPPCQGKHSITLTYTDNDVKVFWLVLVFCVTMLIMMYLSITLILQRRRKLTSYEQVLLKV